MILLTNIFFAAMFLFSPGEKVRTTQPNNYLREGPASYYDVITMVPVAMSVDVVDKKGSWWKVKTEANEMGWLSENSFAKRATAEREEKLMQGKATARASRAELGAAVKGFAKKYVPEGDAEMPALNKFSSSLVKADEMEQFEHSFTAEQLRGYMTIEKPFDLRFHEDAIGYGIAQRIAKLGVVNDPTALAYINMIGSYLNTYTRAYDAGFRFFILNSDKINAFAVPGGYIFISKGLLHACSNESELAAVIAHEMTHVIQRHGLKELHLSQAKVNSEKLFDELEEEVGEEKSDDEKELDQFADDAYNTLITPRLLEYEYEADRLTMLYLKRAGYDPTSLLTVLEKIYAPSPTSTDIFDNNYMKKDDLQMRISAARQLISSEGYRVRADRHYEDRFTSHTSELR